ncbi:transmembrane protease serine 9-like [Amblyraja radiata]|uniref:transmembrane protease serine 9-like n=1 Tax=Amblyraja radiata TaxID=386614 RepID=UPI001402AA23|nr:transmembrane protease serine 9-like [Amblyraja radiata]
MDAVELAIQQRLTQVNMSTQTGSLNHLLIDINSIQFTEISKSQAEFLLKKVSLDGSAAPDSTVATSTDIPTQPTSGCGIKGPTSSRIVGGTNAQNGEWPWQVSLQIGRHVCGASIISDRWLISAAHCFRIQNNSTLWQVYMGSVEVGTGTRRDIRQIIVHPKYALNNPFDYDVAVLELSSPLSLSSVIYPICLPSSQQVFPSGQQCYITGWGRLAYQGSLPFILQEAEVSVIDDQTCRNAYRSHITPRMLCAGVLTGGVGSCQGDSGGPLACSDSRGTWFLAGIVSFGVRCAVPNFPGVYTRVTAVRDWVEQQTGV